ncbi:hypothetical protein A0J61_00662 [Choanephora cucurbitarum]|uniref:Uncharacterized protein n=1 Tax=Choanephora cucurbitarum TaxID=101091 RepID=A0A1C7NUU5_9FUNG|nr:hypothetical protein A0J61_00662 [Choanephora cucurbitarum]
MSKRKRQIK